MDRGIKNMRAHNVASVGADAVITLAPTTGTVHTVRSITASYNGLPLMGSGNLTVSVNGSVIYDVDIAKMGVLQENSQFDTGVGESLEIRLNGLSGLAAKINCEYSDYVP